MKKCISILLLFLMIFNSCYSTYPITKEDIEPEQRINIITKDDERYGIITKKVTPDTLYGIIIVYNDRAAYKRITMPINEIESFEGIENHIDGRIILGMVLMIPLFYGLLMISEII